jgi:predicted RNA-binding protein associated with RNAse of E/G family
VSGRPSPPTITYDFIRPPNRRSTFTAEVLAADDRRLVLRSRLYPSKPLYVEEAEVLNEGYSAVWFLYKDTPYEIGKFYRPDGTWTGYYINICEPVRWERADAATLEPMVDLFLDLWITLAGNPHVLDEDEFDAALAAGYLTAEQIELARATLQTLVARAKRGNFPPRELEYFEPA